VGSATGKGVESIIIQVRINLTYTFFQPFPDMPLTFIQGQAKFKFLSILAILCALFAKFRLAKVFSEINVFVKFAQSFSFPRKFARNFSFTKPLVKCFAEFPHTVERKLPSQKYHKDNSFEKAPKLTTLHWEVF
jgi:hypothetical protein